MLISLSLWIKGYKGGVIPEAGLRQGRSDMN